ncbi:MAG: response regulator transcription factor [SAR202 cluster bacterium]|nr:response regulator transcription factor [SAR202 cluster bacterium]
MESNTQPTKIVLLNNRSLLASGVLNLLEAMEGVAVSVVPSDNDDWAQMAQDLKPEVIILDAGDTALGGSAVTQLLDRHPNAKVVALSLDRDSISVYQVDHVTNTTLDGLREAIQVRKGNPV